MSDPPSTRKGPRRVNLPSDHPLLARQHWPIAVREPRHTVVAFDPARPSKDPSLDPPIERVREWVSNGQVTGRPAFDRHSILTNAGPAPDEPVGVTVGGRLEEGTDRFLLEVQMRADHPEPQRVAGLEEEIRTGRVKYVSMTASKAKGLLEISFCNDPLRAGCEILTTATTASGDVADDADVVVYEVCTVASADDESAGGVPPDGGQPMEVDPDPAAEAAPPTQATAPPAAHVPQTAAPTKTETQATTPPAAREETTSQAAAPTAETPAPAQKAVTQPQAAAPTTATKAEAPAPAQKAATPTTPVPSAASRQQKQQQAPLAPPAPSASVPKKTETVPRAACQKAAGTGTECAKTPHAGTQGATRRVPPSTRAPEVCGFPGRA